MKPHESSEGYPAHVIDMYTRGVICAAEVWNQFVDFHMFKSVDRWMQVLTPPLQQYFKSRATETDLSHWHGVELVAVERLREWYQTHAD
jgi:hypothetical protein